MQDRYHFWVQMAQADQTSISTWETAVRTTAGRCSFGSNADEFMRDKFLFGLNESFSRFREDIFYRDGQRKPEDPPFTLAFVVTQAMSFEAAQQTNKLLAHSPIEEQEESAGTRAELCLLTVFFSFSLFFFAFSFVLFFFFGEGGMSRYVMLLFLRYSPLIVPRFSIPG